MATAHATHHAAKAVEQQRAADHAGRGCRRGAEKRTAAASTAAEHAPLRRAVTLLAIAGLLTVAALIVASRRLGLLHHLAAVPDRAVVVVHVGRTHIRHR